MQLPQAVLQNWFCQSKEKQKKNKTKKQNKQSPGLLLFLDCRPYLERAWNIDNFEILFLETTDK